MQLSPDAGADRGKGIGMLDIDPPTGAAQCQFVDAASVSPVLGQGAKPKLVAPFGVHGAQVNIEGHPHEAGVLLQWMDGPEHQDIAGDDLREGDLLVGGDIDGALRTIAS